jgi:hypothetical protein
LKSDCVPGYLCVRTSQKSECEYCTVPGEIFLNTVPGSLPYMQEERKKNGKSKSEKRMLKLKKSKRGGKSKEGFDRRGPRVQSKVMYEQTSDEHNIIRPHYHVCMSCMFNTTMYTR